MVILFRKKKKGETTQEAKNNATTSTTFKTKPICSRRLSTPFKTIVRVLLLSNNITIVFGKCFCTAVVETEGNLTSYKRARL